MNGTMRRAAIAAFLAAGAGGPAAAGEVLTMRYACERGVEVPATYVNAEGLDGVAVIHVEGTQITLMVSPSASGARYAWPSGGSGYVWWTRGPEATLLWRDGETGEETPVLTECRETP